MIHTGIVGSVAAIGRDVQAVNAIFDARVSGCWATGMDKRMAVNLDTGKIVSHVDEIIHATDALIIAGTDAFSHSLAVHALRHSRHVLLNPALVTSVPEALLLTKTAREAHAILMSGRAGEHDIRELLSALPRTAGFSLVEYNRAYTLADPSRPRNIRAAIQADIEIIVRLMRTHIISIKAKGMCMISDEPEIVNARFEFDNGSVLNYTCNLVSAQPDFLVNIMGMNRILKYNFMTSELSSWAPKKNPDQEIPDMDETHRLMTGNPRSEEIRDFYDHIRSDHAFLSLGDNGFEPLVIADRIYEKVMKSFIHCA